MRGASRPLKVKPQSPSWLRHRSSGRPRFTRLGSAIAAGDRWLGSAVALGVGRDASAPPLRWAAGWLGSAVALRLGRDASAPPLRWAARWLGSTIALRAWRDA